MLARAGIPRHPSGVPATTAADGCGMAREAATVGKRLGVSSQTRSQAVGTSGVEPESARAGSDRATPAASGRRRPESRGLPRSRPESGERAARNGPTLTAAGWASWAPARRRRGVGRWPTGIGGRLRERAREAVPTVECRTRRRRFRRARRRSEPCRLAHANSTDRGRRVRHCRARASAGAHDDRWPLAARGGPWRAPRSPDSGRLRPALRRQSWPGSSAPGSARRTSRSRPPRRPGPRLPLGRRPKGIPRRPSARSA